MLVKHAQMANAMGIPQENMAIVNNGEIIELSEDSIAKLDRVPAGLS